MTTSRVPADLEAVTAVGPEAPAEAVGADAGAVAGIWQAVENLYRSGIHPAMQLCVRCQGQVVIDRAIGHAAGNGPDDPPRKKKVLVTTETPFLIYSASKAVTAMVIHLLDQRDLLRLDDPVCEYIPEFGVRGKQWITVRHVLAHRAGIPNAPPGALNLTRLENPEEIVALLCEAEPTSRAGRQLAYHAITGGFILGELVRRVTGKDIRTVLDEEISRPLGFRWLGYGVRASEVKEVAMNYFTGLPPMPPLSTILTRALGADFRTATTISNDPRFLLGIVPSANIVASANELSRFYQLLLDGGELDGVRVFDRRTIQRATSEQSYLEIDFTLGAPLRYGMGFMLGAKWLSLFGPDTEHAFGHLGFTNVLSWADPERQLAVAFTNSGKPLVYPQIYHAVSMLLQIGKAFPKLPLASPARSRVRAGASRPASAKRRRAKRPRAAER